VEVGDHKTIFSHCYVFLHQRRTPHRARIQKFTEVFVQKPVQYLVVDRAIDVNIAIMRTFVKLREVINSNQEFEKKFNALEAKYDGKFRLVFDAIKELMSSHAVPRKRVIGLEPKIEESE